MSTCTHCGGDLEEGGCHHRNRGAGGYQTVIPKPKEGNDKDGGF